MILTYKYRIKDSSARKTLRRYAYAVNQVWNYCNGLQRDIESRYRSGAPKRKWPSYYDFVNLTKGASRDIGLNSQTIQCICRQFSDSRDKKRRSLKFRTSAGSRRSLGWIPFQKQSRQVNGNSITYLGKCFRYFGSRRRKLPESAKGGAFVEDARGRWYVCFHVEVSDDLATGRGQVGIDLGLKTLATLTDGTVVPALQHYRRYEAALGIAQRANNKNRIRVIHAKIKNLRRDHLHKATAKISRENSLIVVGNVNSTQMAKTRMAKSVLDAAWSMFKTQLEYKARRHRAEFIIVDESFTSQTCSCCGTIPDSSPKGRGALGIRHWKCDGCGTDHDRDVNAAVNILNVALSAKRRGDESQNGVSNTAG